MPRAGRSVGAAIGRNPLLIFVPDHRVINRGGSVGRFAGKWNRKPGLLDLEKRLTAKIQDSGVRIQNRTGHGRGLGIFTGAGLWLAPDF
jgi:alkylated DNA nucleotide flippase Atl1